METYTKQFDKLTSLYIQGKVKPLDPGNCFAGNVLQHHNWFGLVHSRKWRHLDQSKRIFLNFYSISDARRMEKAFMNNINMALWLVRWIPSMRKKYEDMVFNAFCKGLEMLKKIHEEKGEEIGEKVFHSRTSETTLPSAVIA